MALTKVSRGLLSTGIVDNSTTTAITIDSSQNVGIGLTNPSDYYAENLVVAAPAEGGITIKSASTDQAYLMFADGTSGSDQYRGYLGHNHLTDATSLVGFGTIGLSSVAETVFTTASTERMRIDASGNVGISTTAPLAALTIGNNSADGTVDYTQGLVLTDTSSGVPWVHAGIVATGSTNFDGNLIFATDGNATRSPDTSGLTERMRIDASGNVGIGCSPTQELEIKAASVPTLKLNQAGTYGAEIALRGNDLDIAGSANDIVFYTGGNNDVSTTERMRIDSSGNLLVGTTTAGTKTGDGVIAFGANGGVMSNFSSSVANNGTLDIAINTAGGGYQGFLSVANTVAANAAARTQSTFSVFGRSTDSSIQQIATDTGTAGATFTVTTPSNGVIRVTNTSGATCSISMHFFGGASL